MTTSSIRRHYGHGAARLWIAAEPVRYAESPSLLPNATSAAATILVGGLTVFALIRAIEPAPDEASEIKIVQFQEPPPPAPEPEPEPEMAKLPDEPPPPPAPEPEPKPEPVVVAQAPPPPKPKPLPPKPKPPARKPTPPPLPKPEPVRAPVPEPAPQWKQAALPPPPPKPATPPPPRPLPVKVEPMAPPPQVVAEATPPPAWKPVALPDKPAPSRAPAPRVSIDAVKPPPNAAPPEPPSRQGSLPPGVPAPKKPAVVPVSVRVAMPAAAAPDLVADGPPGPAPRAAPTGPPAQPAPQRRLPPGPMKMDAISADAPANTHETSLDTRTYERTGAAPAPRESARSEPNQRLRGVPLGSLAACRTDRLEDDLKQKVLAAVRNRAECMSAAGRYSFVETKNLNAFLMWVERAPGRAQGDRCAELSFALSCLEKSGGGR